MQKSLNETQTLLQSAFWELAEFKRPTHQISFHTIAALKTLHFKGAEKVYGEE